MKVSIVGGAGTVGSSAAFSIATQGLVDEVVLLDIAKNLATAHALDIAEAVVVCGYDTMVRAGDYEDMTGSGIAIVAVSAPLPSNTPVIESNTPPQPVRFSRQNLLSRNIGLISEIAKAIEQFCPDAILITASNPVEALNYASFLLSSARDRKRFIGYSLNDTTRFRVWIAHTLGVEPSRVGFMTMGEHGDSQVPIFSALKVDGKSVNLSEQTKQELRTKPLEYLPYWGSLKPGRSSGWLSGAGLATMVNAISNNTREIFPCSAILAGEYGYEGFSMTVPAILGSQGIHEILEWKLDADEKQRLEESTSILRQAVHSLKEILRNDS